jgi:hypothetical protein
MSHSSVGHGSGSGQRPVRRTTGKWVAVAVLLAVGIVVPLLVFLYDSVEPTLWGFPFYYWFQFLLILVASVLTVSAYLLVREQKK